MVCQLNMNQVGRTGRIDVRAKDIIDIIDSYEGGGYGMLTQHELGGQDWGGFMSMQKILQILLIATKEEDMVCQLNMNQVGRTGGINVKAEDIIDIIDGQKGGGYGV